MNKMYRVVDPQHVYPIVAVELTAVGLGEAAVKAAEAMMGCQVLDVGVGVVQNILESLKVQVWDEDRKVVGCWVDAEHAQVEAIAHLYRRFGTAVSLRFVSGRDDSGRNEQRSLLCMARVAAVLRRQSLKSWFRAGPPFPGVVRPFFHTLRATRNQPPTRRDTMAASNKILGEVVKTVQRYRVGTLCWKEAAAQIAETTGWSGKDGVHVMQKTARSDRNLYELCLLETLKEARKFLKLRATRAKRANTR